MEIFRSFGLEPAIRAGAADVEWQMLSVRTLAEAAGGVAIAVGLPTRQQATVISPTTPACVPQDHLEPLLLAHLRSLGGDVRLGAEITDVRRAPRACGSPCTTWPPARSRRCRPAT